MGLSDVEKCKREEIEVPGGVTRVLGRNFLEIEN